MCIRDRYKVELIEDLPEDAEISFYKQGEGFTDLCAGPHLMNTKGIKAYKLISSSMAYWRGDSNKAQLQRIYGTAFATKDELNAYLEHLEDIKKRDHNKLGREMELFTTVDVIGQGLPPVSYTHLDVYKRQAFTADDGKHQCGDIESDQDEDQQNC